MRRERMNGRLLCVTHSVITLKELVIWPRARYHERALAICKQVLGGSIDFPADLATDHHANIMSAQNISV
jgi:hypothetical protein